MPSTPDETPAQARYDRDFVGAWNEQPFNEIGVDGAEEMFRAGALSERGQLAEMIREWATRETPAPRTSATLHTLAIEIERRPRPLEEVARDA